MGRRTMSSDEARRLSHSAALERARRERLRAAAEHEQFMRDLRGDHDSPASYAWLPPADSTPCIAEILSAWED